MRCGNVSSLSRGVSFVLLVLTAAIAVVLFHGIYQAVISPFAVLDSLVAFDHYNVLSKDTVCTFCLLRGCDLFFHSCDFCDALQ